jgi:hypothetical protein
VQLRSKVGRFGAGGPRTDDGDVTSPSEIEGEAVGPAGALTSHAQHGRELFGRPDTGVESGSGAIPNAGADSHGAGVISPADEEVVSNGAQRNDDPFDAAEAALEPPADTGSEGDDGAESFLPPSEAASEVEPADELPDSIVDPVG